MFAVTSDFFVLISKNVKSIKSFFDKILNFENSLCQFSNTVFSVSVYKWMVI